MLGQFLNLITYFFNTAAVVFHEKYGLIQWVNHFKETAEVPTLH